MSEFYKKEDVLEFLNLHCPKDMWEYQIEDLPSMDIVHCKDCKYSIEVKESDDIICKHPSQHSTYERTGDDYCSYGARKEQEHD